MSRNRLLGAAVALNAMFWAASVSMAQTVDPSAQSAEWAKVVASAKGEGKVSLYASAATPVLVRLKADFEKAYPGIILEYARLTSPGNAVTIRLDLERNSRAADGADVAITNETLWAQEGAKAGLFKPVQGPSLRQWPSSYLFRGTVPLLSLEPLVMAYNVNLVKTPITGYPDLLRPEFKGKITVNDPVTATAVAWYDWVEKTQGLEFLRKFAAQGPRIIGTAPANTQAAASGEYPVTAYTIMSVALPLIELGAPIKIVIPKPSFGVPSVGVVAGWSQRPNAGLVFMDYLMSARGQGVWHGRGESASPLQGIPGSLDASTIKPYDAAPYTPEAVKAYTEKWRQLVKAVN